VEGALPPRTDVAASLGWDRSGLGVLVATMVLSLWPGRNAGVVALLATTPFLVVARYAWSRLRRPAGRP
jgi:hypothetical protein